MPGYSNYTENQIDVEIMSEISGFSLETIKEKLRKNSERLSFYGNIEEYSIKDNSCFFL